MFNAWKANPTAVHSSWDQYFKSNPTLEKPAQGQSTSQMQNRIQVGVHAQRILSTFRKYGHFHANLDPLGLKTKDFRKELVLSRLGVTEEDLDLPVTKADIDTALSADSKETLDDGYTLRDLIHNLETSYCGHVGVEYMHIQDRVQCNWIRTSIEKNIFTKSLDDNTYTPTKEERLSCLDRLTWGTLFEEFLGEKFQDKRFGCDGAEVIIPGLKTLIDHGADLGIEDMIIGMAHRGRLNVLANVLRKPIELILHEFQKGTVTRDEVASGDVKYHLGVECERPTKGGKKVHLSLVPNPSHLETVNPVVEGSVAAVQQRKTGDKQSKVMSILIHGDGSFAGQGVVYETITLSSLPKYSTGGTIHVIINNQISFTTNPSDACPSEYCTDVARAAGAPVFHVNGDDPDAVCRVFEIAVEWRQKFNKDVVVDIVCYRRFGHNEVDQPAFTQPLMYQAISKHPKTLSIYSQKLIQEGLITAPQFDQMKKDVRAFLDKYFDESVVFSGESQEKVFNSHWQQQNKTVQPFASTGIDDQVLKTVGKALVTLPKNFTPHPTLGKQLSIKKKMLDSEEDIDWGTAEALAFGSLVVEGHEVRISGQDAERGTFAHRNAVLHDYVTAAEYTPLCNIEGTKSHFAVKNSFLSEYAALGYELGYSLESPDALVIWEAQFGDFANGAQIIFDQFVASCEQKWGRYSGLVMLLPHGMDGMGPEHSSARLERFLQLSDQSDEQFCSEWTPAQLRDTNIIVANLTTPANIFHALRRQIHSEFKKPLVIMSPKSLLRHPLVKSPVADFGPGTELRRVIPEIDPDLAPDNAIVRVLFCSGKVFYDLFEERKANGIKNVAIIRVEQLAPFPSDLVAAQVKRYPNAEIVWCQEEHMNHGAWTYMFFMFKMVFKHIQSTQKELVYIGRPTSASPATGSAKKHVKEHAILLHSAFQLKL